MPNYVTNRLVISGPAAEIERFQSTCIRSHSEEKPDEVSFDFEALIPMPSEITATLNDHSDSARTRALKVSGFDGWYSWRCFFWGTKWNALDLAIQHAEPGLLDLVFYTAWSSPEPIFEVLATEYPQLKGYALGTDPAMDWSLFGVITGGAYSSVCLDAAALHLLIMDCTLTPVLSRTSARTLVQNWCSITSGDEGARATPNNAALASELVKAALPADVVARFEFVEHHACAEYLAGRDSDAIGSGAAADLSFFLAQDRSRTNLDIGLMEELVAHVREEALHSSCPATSPITFASQATRSLQGCSEEELRAWAAVAMYRPGVSLNMSDEATLWADFESYAARLCRDALTHLNRRAAELCPPAPIAAGREG